MPPIGHPPLEKPSLCFCLLCVARQVRWPSLPLPRNVPAVPCLAWGFSLQRSSCGKKTQGGAGGRKGRGKRRCLGPVFCRPSLRLLERASHLLRLNTLSVLRAHLTSWYTLAENYPLPLNPTKWGRKGMLLHTKGYFEQEGAGVFPL